MEAIEQKQKEIEVLKGRAASLLSAIDALLNELVEAQIARHREELVALVDAEAEK